MAPLHDSLISCKLTAYAIITRPICIDRTLANGIQVWNHPASLNLLRAYFLRILRPATADNLRRSQCCRTVCDFGNSWLGRSHRFASAAIVIALTAHIAAGTAHAGVAGGLGVIRAVVRELAAIAEVFVFLAVSVLGTVADLEEFIIIWAIHYGQPSQYAFFFFGAR